MSINRIQKLLFSEYCDFEDMVLVESPFAETTRDGKGLRQVHLGLTPSKLVLATDVLPLAGSSAVSYTSGVDPDIETFELIAVYPIECVSLSVFHRRKRQSLKARFCNNKVLYFELGGYEKRKMFWNLWCEKVKFLNPDNPNSSHSETSVATSTTNSTLYLVSSKRFVDGSGNSQLWCKFATGDFMRTNPAKWTDKYLYLGKHLEESPLKYSPCQNPLTIEQFVRKRAEIGEDGNKKVVPLATASNLTTNGLAAINRFSTNVDENCSTALFLPAENVIVNAKFNDSTTQSTDMFTMYNTLANRRTPDFCEMAESSVRIWEFYKVTSSSMSARGKHRRRYALTPQPHFFHGLGPWNVNQGERFSLQMKRAVSMVAIRRQPVEPELRLSVSRRQLIASISCEVLQGNEKLINFNNNTIRIPPKSPMIFFWTPEYWYRPRTARDTYQELQTHLRKIHDYHHFKDSIQIVARKSQRRRRTSDVSSDSTTSEEDEAAHKTRRSRKRHLLNKLKPITKKVTDKDGLPSKEERKETPIQTLKRMLRMEVSLTAWDFDSNTLAFQLTLIDRDLFLKITPSELGILVWQQSSKNAPNVGAMIAFSHRISCLIATEILKDDSEKIRARLVARFICAADKCYRISNFQSCRSLLCGLQSPPVYRLYSMWTYVRKRHSSKYQTFEKLCRLYRDPRLSIYQKTFLNATKTAPYLPFIGDLIDRLLDRIPDHKPKRSSTTKTATTTAAKQEKVEPAKKEEATSLIKKLLSTFKVWHVESKSLQITTSITESSEDTAKVQDQNDAYCRSLERYEDNRQRRLDECVALLAGHQKAAANYTYSSNELAREYLLKARYREDKDNFMHSFNVEPPLQFER